ncbi:hypothetical protein GQ42DRAFT_129639 [Ramicandelaber brevisporus]|nr:hypothetical protein GQ42DRAFT_129639 [Ramicandelaber brevisporus]
MSESRQELLKWVNDLLQLNYTKIEQLGSGAAYAQIVDSIYLDVPLTKVKFGAKQEYEYVNNFKVLQQIFDKHQIPRVVPVERLIKLRFQDNFEFLQWLKKYWDTYSPGGHYDAISRRRGQSIDVSGPAGVARPGSSQRIGSAAGVSAAAGFGGPVRRGPPSERGPSRGPVSGPSGGGIGSRAGSVASSGAGGGMPNANSAALQSQINSLTEQNTKLKVTVDSLERERDFYFNKLREVEVFTQSLQASEGSIEAELVAQIQAILYSTADGFDQPQDGGDYVDQPHQSPHDEPQYEQDMQNMHLGEEDTF